jgi:hypothetical protein
MATVKELRLAAKEMGLKSYSTMKKAELETAIEALTATQITIPEVTSPTMTQEQQDILFDLKRYKDFVLAQHLRTLAPTMKQKNLIEALERNFYIKFKNFYTMGQASDSISKCYDAIINGQIKPRPVDKVIESLKNMNKPVARPASKAQIELINKLEKQTGVANITIIRDFSTADSIIKRYIAISKLQADQRKEEEKALVCPECAKNPFVSFVLRMFGARA